MTRLYDDLWCTFGLKNNKQKIPITQLFLVFITLIIMACEPNSASTTIIKTVDTSFDAAIVDQHIKRGNRAFALRQYEEAVQEYGQASQLLGEHFGQDAPECADVLTLYGKALLHNAIQQNGVLGSQAGRATVDEEAHPCK
jgi:hypothetical protein